MSLNDGELDGLTENEKNLKYFSNSNVRTSLLKKKDEILTQLEEQNTNGEQNQLGILNGVFIPVW